jgi:hypothetical protein
MVCHNPSPPQRQEQRTVAFERKGVFRLKSVALPCGGNGATRLYTANPFTGRCPHARVYCYVAGFRNFSGVPPRPISPEAVASVTRWPKRLFLSSASDPFHPDGGDPCRGTAPCLPFRGQFCGDLLLRVQEQGRVGTVRHALDLGVPIPRLVVLTGNGFLPGW